MEPGISVGPNRGPVAAGAEALRCRCGRQCVDRQSSRIAEKLRRLTAGQVRNAADARRLFGRYHPGETAARTRRRPAGPQQRQRDAAARRVRLRVDRRI